MVGNQEIFESNNFRALTPNPFKPKVFSKKYLQKGNKNAFKNEKTRLL